jgi:hypothetical protein
VTDPSGGGGGSGGGDGMDGGVTGIAHGTFAHPDPFRVSSRRAGAGFGGVGERFGERGDLAPSATHYDVAGSTLKVG